jgi:restriction system protein
MDHIPRCSPSWSEAECEESLSAGDRPLLMRLPKAILAHDGYEQMGTHVPQLSASGIDYFNSENVLRAKRFDKDGRVSYWDGERLYHAWDGAPCYFNLCD